MSVPIELPLTQELLDALVANWARGIKRVTADGLTQEFASLPDMWDAIVRIRAYLSGAPMNRLLTSRKGL